MYNTDATIVDIDMVNDGKYVPCTTCRKKETLINGHYFCEACQRHVINPRQAYKLVVRATDKEEDIGCVIFNDVAIALIGITGDDLIMKSFEQGADDPDWIREFLIENLSGWRAILRIKIDSYNLSPNLACRFIVSKFLGDDIIMVEKNKNTSNLGASTVLATYATDCGFGEEANDFFL
ncbi:hypothetical protein L1987_42644 [Smallanthus sonchifolius]|uniref:Uncharacterized protein n=1 Tax=Smallanthus sonchifolius TaxID=185202 RepID=A0ACB9GKL0_9ASTR|nr:hypothetical protein L1987_42644 [Smallanthus sonchifolius]